MIVQGDSATYFQGLEIRGLLLESGNCKVLTDAEEIHRTSRNFLHSIVFSTSMIKRFNNSPLVCHL